MKIAIGVQIIIHRTFSCAQPSTWYGKSINIFEFLIFVFLVNFDLKFFINFLITIILLNNIKSTAPRREQIIWWPMWINNSAYIVRDNYDCYLIKNPKLKSWRGSYVSTTYCSSKQSTLQHPSASIGNSDRHTFEIISNITPRDTSTN